MAESIPMQLARLQEKVEAMGSDVARVAEVLDTHAREDRDQFATINGSLNRIESTIGQNVKVLETKHLVIGAVLMALLQLASLAVAIWSVIHEPGRSAASMQRSDERIAASGAVGRSVLDALHEGASGERGQVASPDRTASQDLGGQRD